MVTSTLTTTSASAQSWPVDATLVAGDVIKVELWGPGSGGSGSSTSFRAGGSGGAYTVVPAYVITPADVSGGIPYLLTAGAAGTGAANSAAVPDTTWQYSKNMVRNMPDIGTGTGVVSSTGTGSPLPTNWLLLGNGDAAWSTTGLTANVIGSGADDGGGRPYVDIQFTGTTSSGTTGIIIKFEPQQGTGVHLAPCLPATQYTGSFYISFTAGATTNISGIAATGNVYTASTTATTFFNFMAVGSSVLPTASPVVRNFTDFTNVTTPYFANFVSVSCTASAQIGGSASGITLRIAGPQMETGASVTSFVAPNVNRAWAKGGVPNSGTTGGASPLAYSCFPFTGAFSGGAGATHAQGGGGGGAAGKDGAGASSTTGTGGTADNGSGGAAGVSNVEGGGGASAAVSPSAAGAPGGGGGAATTTNSGSAGGRGQIRLTWTPTQRLFRLPAQMLPIMAQ